MQKTVVFSSKIKGIEMYTLCNMGLFAVFCGVIATCVAVINGYYLLLALLVLGGVLIGLQVSDVLRGE